MDFASEHVFQPRCDDEAFEEVDAAELEAVWSTSSPVYLAKHAGAPPEPSPLGAAGPPGVAAAAAADIAMGPAAEPAAEPLMAAARADDEDSEAYGDGLDATVALSALQDADYAGFANKVDTPAVMLADADSDDGGAVDEADIFVSADGVAAAAPPPDAQPRRSSFKKSFKGIFGKKSGGRKTRTTPPPPPPPAPPAPPQSRSTLPTKSKLNLMYKKKASPLPKAARSRREVDTNVVSIKLGTLLQDSQVHSGECTQCATCHAALSHYSKMSGPDEARVWTCEFCGNANPVDLDDEELPTAETVDYILKPAPRVVASDVESIVIFCVDTSGSMCVSTAVPGRHKFRGSRTEAMARELATFNDDGSLQTMPHESRGVVYVSRLQAVQAAVEAQLTQLKSTHPNTQCGLVTFNSDVALVGDGSKPIATLAGDTLASGEAVRAATEAHTELLTQPVKASAEALTKKVFGLEEGGQTALGPAVCAAIELAADRPGSRVVICTDGLANIGVGSLEDEEQIPAARAFYEGLAAHAMDRGVSVSIVTIDGTDADLDSIECLSDRTGGDLEIVDPLKLADNFSSMLAEAVVASKVEVTMKLHKGLQFRNEAAACSSLTRQLGNVNANSEAMFEFKVGDAKLDVAELPFQVQIKYTTPSGMEALRVISRRKPVTTDRSEALKSMNVAMCAARAAQVSSELASKGKVKEARLNSRAWRHTMAAHVCSEEATVGGQRSYANFLQANQDVEDTYEAPARAGSRRSDASTRWQYKSKKATWRDFA
mmetsp:Transcript_18563/g.55040  ORF Transcript_18563/g.55040 Transcript_18563/m.55040 type:complete len:772 (+) Transcript_18563:121-2436(+)